MESMSQTTVPELLSIGAFARRSRLSLKALRLYDQLVLLAPARIDPDNGYRYYTEDQVARARLIGLLRGLDMPLGWIAVVLDLPAHEAVDEIGAYWAEVEASMAVKRRLVAYLERHLEGRGDRMFEVVTRQVPDQRVIAIQRPLTVEGLPAFISDSYGELRGAIETAGARVAGPFFVIYRGQVNEDSDGPVEVCVPFDGSIDPSNGMTVRHEPAHGEAYTTITLAQCQFPGILDAYGAVEHWIEAGGKSPTGDPREVYFVDGSTIGPDDPFCDIAFPIA